MSGKKYAYSTWRSGKKQRTMFSTYFYELDETAKHCYREKLDKAGLIDDPYVMQEQGIDSVNW